MGPIVAGSPGPITDGVVSAPDAGMRRRVVMSREAGARYECTSCGAVLVYEKGCPCPPEMEHKEVCCEQDMTLVAG